MSTSRARGKAEFYCGTKDSVAALIAKHPKRGDVTLIKWASANHLVKSRCVIIAERFQRTNANGTLNYIVSGTLNNLSVLCASYTSPTNEVISCPSERLLLTLPPNVNAKDVIEEINAINQGRSSDPVVLE